MTPSGTRASTVRTGARDASAQRSSALTAGHRLRLLRTCVVAGLLAAFALAPRVWLNHPFFGPLPTLSRPTSLPEPLDDVVFLGLVGLLVPVLLLRRPRLAILAWCGLFAVRTLPDELTWQPYFYQYAFMLLSLAFADGAESAVLNINRAIVASIYFWSGVSKFNPAFIENGLRDQLRTLAPHLPVESLVALSPVIPALEVAIGLSLLFPRTRTVGMSVAIVMHAILLLVLGPLGLDYNRVVWPWNVVMIAVLVLLFTGSRDVGARQILWTPRFRLHALVVVLFCIVPVFSYVGLWPRYLAFRLYSHDQDEAGVFVTQAVLDQMPAGTRSHLTPYAMRSYVGYFDVAAWSQREIGAFVPPEDRLYRLVAAKVCRLAKAPNDVLLTIQGPPRVGRPRSHREYYCSDLEDVPSGH